MAQNQIHNHRTHIYPSDKDLARFWDDAPGEPTALSTCIDSIPNKHTNNPHFSHLHPLPHSSRNFNPALTNQHRPHQDSEAARGTLVCQHHLAFSDHINSSPSAVFPS